MEHPKLRALDMFPVRQGELTYLALRDPEGYTDKLVMLSPLEAFLAAQLDGDTDPAAAALRVSDQTGVEVPASHVAALVRQLDENLMLESERFRRHQAQVLAGYLDAEVRPPFLAGRCYSEEPEALRREIELFFQTPGAPDRPAGPDGSPPILGLVAPHIDFQRGKAGYAWAYREVLRSGLADLYVLIGVAHATPATPLVLTEKDYGTPLGPARVDRRLARALAKAAPYDLQTDQLVHRTEHSLEFQAVCLKYAQAQGGGDFKVLPLLASSCDLGRDHGGPRAGRVLAELARLLKAYKGRVCLLAGVDLAHVGPRFGDSEAVTPRLLARVEKEDRSSIERLLALDPDGFLESVMGDGNKRKVCGVAALHSFAWLLRELQPQARGELLHYGHAADPAGGEVTFTSIVFR